MRRKLALAVLVLLAVATAWGTLTWVLTGADSLLVMTAAIGGGMALLVAGPVLLAEAFPSRVGSAPGPAPSAGELPGGAGRFQPPTIQRVERVIERQVLVVRCKHCGELTAADLRECRHCGGPPL